jgi:hypothetical protein
VRFVITSGSGVREVVDQRKDAKSALDCVLTLVKRHRPNVRVFDEDGKLRSLNDLHRIAAEEEQQTRVSKRN